MRFSRLSILAVLGLAAAACSDQKSADHQEQVGTSSSKLSNGPTGPKASLARRGAMTPPALDGATAQALTKNGRYERTSKLSDAAKNDVHQHRAHSVPHFAGSYTLAGTTYPYTMVGGEPSRGGETRVKTTMIPVSLVFDEYGDANGNALTVDITPTIDPVLRSPNFQKSSYGTGFTQFTDAIQRAEFWSVMGPNWHTLVEQPRMQKTLTIEVPVGAAQVFQASDGAYITLLDQNFFFTQFNTIAQLADFHYDELAMLVTSNVFLTDGNPNDGYILGFHTAWDAQNPESYVDPGTAKFVQTFAWASWIEPGIFGGFSDVTALSHEIAEWANDPFVDNTTQNWSFPGIPDYCQNNLETGDPVEVLANAAFPVTLHGFTYHPQTEALLQWFTRATPSTAFHGAYSYPDTTALTEPSHDCGQ